jgi:hypothetical protein
MQNVYIHYYETKIRVKIDDDFLKQYIVNWDPRIYNIYYIKNYLNIITTNEDLLEEIECRYNDYKIL